VSFDFTLKFLGPSLILVCSHKEKTSTLKKKQLIDARAFRKITLKDLVSFLMFRVVLIVTTLLLL
jgi:hypothetical protein